MGIATFIVMHVRVQMKPALLNIVPEIFCNGTTSSTAPRAIASLGIPKTTQVASSWATVAAPAFFISSKPSAPSSPIPVMITPTAFWPAVRATDRKRTSTLGR